MREKVRKTIVESPRAMDVAYALVLTGSFIGVGTNGIGTGSGP